MGHWVVGGIDDQQIGRVTWIMVPGMSQLQLQLQLQNDQLQLGYNYNYMYTCMFC